MSDPITQKNEQELNTAIDTDINQTPPTQEEAALADAEAGDDTPKAAPLSPLTLILEYLELFVVCLCIILTLFSFFFRICSVSGDSMLPTLTHGQTLLVSDLFYEPEAGDIIIFHQTSDVVERFNEPIVKRVIATEGQHIRIDFKTGIIEIDDEALTEDYIQLVDTLGREIGEYQLYAEHNIRMEPSPDGTTHRIFEATVPEGHLFVMGDNRNNSSDSRTNVIGFVDERRVLGQVLCRISPFESFGDID